MNPLEKLFMDGSFKKFLDQAVKQVEAKEVDAGEGEGGDEERKSKASKVSKVSTKKSTAMVAEKQSVIFQERLAAQRLGSSMERLSKELDAARQNYDQLAMRNNDYLHYL